MSFWKPFITGAVASASVLLLVQNALFHYPSRKKILDTEGENDNTKHRIHSITISNSDTKIQNRGSMHTTTTTTTTTRNTTANASSTGPQQKQLQLQPPVVQVLDSPHLDMRMIRKAEGAIQKRTSRLTVVVERCTNDYNYSAILRTTEALGIQNVWIIGPTTTTSTTSTRGCQPYQHHHPEFDTDGTMGQDSHGSTYDTPLFSMRGTQIHANQDDVEARKLHHLYAQRATEWLSVREFDSTTACLRELRATGHTIWATDLSQHAMALDDESIKNELVQIPHRLAICFGTEAVGCTPELLEGADRRVYLPLRGFADSLNLSVATALVIHHLFLLDPTIEGAMSEQERRELRQLWFPKLASQRLQSAREKKERVRLQAKLTKYEEFKRKRDAGISLHKDQVIKIALLPALRKQLNDYDAPLQKRAEQSVADLVENPPAPITDMRRADEHRTCYVGKKTITKNGWINMPATTGYDTKAGVSMADFFRGRSQREDSSNGAH